VLTPAEVVPYLLRQGLVRPQTVVAGDVRVIDATRRNANYKVVSAGGPSYLLKQGVGPERATMVDGEAAVYRWMGADGGPTGGRFGRYLPRLCLHDPADHVLVLELVRDAPNLQEYHQRRGRCSPVLAAALGRALGTLHQLPGAPGAGEAGMGIVPRPAPWVLGIHRPDLPLYHSASQANLHLIATIQRFPQFGALLDALRGLWQPRALVHCDMKWENVLVAPASPGGRRTIKLVDWEAAGWGDPCWDTGAVFGEYLGFWLLSIPITGVDPPDRFLELARYPLAQIQPAMRRFWQAYSRQVGLDGAAAREALLRSVCYAAARLVQTAFEQGQGAVQLTGNALCFLQVSLNMLQRPDEAAVHLLGIPCAPGQPR
jgi:Phosphotransferase enzyme family